MYLQLLALLLGFKHSYDADHLIAVSNLLVKSKSSKQTVQMSVSWAVGHMLTASIITIILFQFKDFFFAKILSYFDIVVGLMLVILGVVSILSLKSKLTHAHTHSHGETTHEHPHIHLSQGDHYHVHMFGIGIVHGLASNDELLILFAASLGITSLAGILVYVAIFSIGVITGMVVFGVVTTHSLNKMGESDLNTMITLVVGTISIVYGVWTLVPIL